MNDEAWIVTGSGKLYATSQWGSLWTIEATAPTYYLDEVVIEPITDPEQRQQIAARLREIADSL